MSEAPERICSVDCGMEAPECQCRLNIPEMAAYAFETDFSPASCANDVIWLGGRKYVAADLSVAEAARVLLEAMPLARHVVEEMHKQIDWCRNHQITNEISHPSQLDGGTTCAEDIQDAWEAALRALAKEPSHD